MTGALFAGAVIHFDLEAIRLHAYIDLYKQAANRVLKNSPDAFTRSLASSGPARRYYALSATIDDG